MRSKTALIFLFIFSVLFLQCRQKIIPTQADGISVGQLTAEIIISGSLVQETEVTFAVNISGGTNEYLIRWDFNSDGIWDTAYSPSKVSKYTFWETKIYTVRVAIKDSGNASLEITKQFTISDKPVPLSGSFYYTGPLMSNMDINFVPSATGGNGNYRYSFDFDNDGTYDIVDVLYTPFDPNNTDPNNQPPQITHKYLSGGTKTVKMRVNDGNGYAYSELTFEVESHTKYLIIYQSGQEIYKMFQDGSTKTKIADGISPSCRSNGAFIAYAKTVGDGILKRFRLSKIDRNGGSQLQLLIDEPVEENHEIKYYTESDTTVSPNSSTILFNRNIKTLTIPPALSADNANLLKAYCDDTNAPDYVQRQAFWNNFILYYDIVTEYIPSTGQTVIVSCTLKTSLTKTQKENAANLLYTWKDVVTHIITDIGGSTIQVTFGSYAPVAISVTTDKNIYSVGSGGGSPSLIIDNAEHPDYSPDGATIAFTRNGNIYTQGATNIFIAGASHPAFSPDGQSIAFSMQSDMSAYGEGVVIYQIFLSYPGTKFLLTHSGTFDCYTSWKPDSRKIIFSRFLDNFSPYIDPLTMQTGAGGMYSIFTGDVPETSYWFAMTLDQGSAINLISPHYLSN